MTAPTPVLSILVVSDYAAGEARAWDDLRATLTTVARQAEGKPVDVLVAEQDAYRASAPADLAGACPGLRLLWVDGAGSYALKNAGVAAAGAPHVAILDADCLPAPSWLDALLAALERYPQAAVISGRTRYAGGNLTERALALLSRSYVDRGVADRTRHISNNNAVYRRDVYLDHRLPEHTSPFASALQAQRILAAGGELRFEPAMAVTHAFEGWAMERDIRRQMGYATLMNRCLDRSLPHAGVLRMGWLALPVFAGGRLLKSWWQGLRYGRHYGVHWYEQPFLWGLAFVLIGMELGGMATTLRGGRIVVTAYR